MEEKYKKNLSKKRNNKIMAAEFKVKLRNLRIAPRKVRLVADLIRGKTTKEAKIILRFTVKKACLPLSKLLDSALANAKNTQLDEQSLFISKINVDEGPKLKRWRPRARGVAYPIQKKVSHINLVLKEIQGAEKKTIKKDKEEKQEKKEQKVKEKKTAKKDKTVSALKPKAETRPKRIFRRKSF